MRRAHRARPGRDGNGRNGWCGRSAATSGRNCASGCGSSGDNEHRDEFGRDTGARGSSAGRGGDRVCLGDGRVRHLAVMRRRDVHLHLALHVVRLESSRDCPALGVAHHG